MFIWKVFHMHSLSFLYLKESFKSNFKTARKKRFFNRGVARTPTNILDSFATIVNSFKPFTIAIKLPVLDVFRSPVYSLG